MVRRKRSGEFALIARYFRPLADSPAALNLTDDAAIIQPRPGEGLVLTADMVVEGIHFLPEDAPSSVARKALRVNLSDLASKGATPYGYLMSLALPADWDEAWVAGFARGLAGDQKVYGITLLGGDTTRASGRVSISVTAIGRVPEGRMVTRSGAQEGDIIFVSGTIGDGALGLRLRLGTLTPLRGSRHLLDRYLHPQPRVPLAPAILRYASASMDVSDGLIGDLAHICEASGVGAEVRAENIPLSSGARAQLQQNSDGSVLHTILNGGDDYEVLATVPADDAAAFRAAADRAGVPVAEIGRIIGKQAYPVVIDSEGKAIPLSRPSHTHF